MRILVCAALVAGAITTFALVAAIAGAADTPLPEAANGKTVTLVASGLSAPTQIAINGSQVFVAAGGNGRANGGVFMIKDGKPVALPGSPPFSFGIAYKDGVLYASSGPKIYAWSHWNGKKFMRKRTVVTGPEGTPGFNGLAFGPDGRIYTGVTLAGGAYDHTRPDLPLANTFVAITPSTGKISVVATGLRQAWMPLFVTGAKGAFKKGPLVSELAGNNVDPANGLPVDLLVVATQGANFGFPDCFSVKPADCATYAKAWGSFPGHTSPMGLATGRQPDLHRHVRRRPSRQARHRHPSPHRRGHLPVPDGFQGTCDRRRGQREDHLRRRRNRLHLQGQQLINA